MTMKDFGLLLWLPQLGLSVALPLALFGILGSWLHSNLGWGNWTIWVGFGFGLYCGAIGFRDSLKAMERMSGEKKNTPPPVSFNEHT